MEVPFSRMWKRVTTTPGDVHVSLVTPTYEGTFVLADGVVRSPDRLRLLACMASCTRGVVVFRSPAEGPVCVIRGYSLSRGKATPLPRELLRQGFAVHGADAGEVFDEFEPRTHDAREALSYAA